MPALVAGVPRVGLAQHGKTSLAQRRQPAAAARPHRIQCKRIEARQRLSHVARAAPAPPVAPVVLPFDVEQARRDWDEADQEALAESAKFDEVAGKPKIVCFRVKRILDLTIKEPLGPDMQPKWPIENYMANPNNFVSMVYPPDCVSKSDQYHYEIRLAKLRFVKWFIIPIYRLEMRYLPDRGLLARSWTVVLEQETLPNLLKGIDLNMRMRSVTNVHREKDDVEEFKDGGKFRYTRLEADVRLEIATYIPKVIRILPGLSMVGDGILDTILVAIQGIVRDKLQEDYLRLIKLREEEQAGRGGAAGAA